MPKLDGFEVLKAIKSTNPETQVLMLTGHGDEDMVIRALKEGANDYIKKPIDLDNLSNSLTRAYESIRHFRKTIFNASTIVKFEQKMEIENDLEGIYALTSYITSINHIYFSKQSCEKIKLALIETLRNSIEHGNLEIDYNEKGQLLEAGKFNEEIKRRVETSPYKERRVKINYSLDEERVKYTIEDQGNGFNWKELPGTNPENLFKRNGRGIVLIKMMIDEISYNDKGNCVTLIKKTDLSKNKETKNVWISHELQNKSDIV